jgi:hypothetical protein
MKLVIDQPHYAVFDDVLPRQGLQKLRYYFANEANLEFINRVERLKAWSLDNGHPLCTPVIATELGCNVLRTGSGNYFSYPSDSPLDLLLDFVLKHQKTFAPWIGRAGKAWRTATACGYVYPQETGLDWHDDGGGYSGAFSFYAHEEWRPQWGGELLIAANDKKSKMNGAFVLPMPNRLVLVKGGVPHKIARVSKAAGSAHRISVTGAFAVEGVEAVSGGTLVTDLL